MISTTIQNQVLSHLDNNPVPAAALAKITGLHPRVVSGTLVLLKRQGRAISREEFGVVGWLKPTTGKP
jgi:hypothetical protein